MSRPRTPADAFFDALTLVVLLVLAAVFQQGLGPWAWGLAKPPFLLSLAAYYAMTRPLWLAVPGAFVAGAWADGLGSVPGAPSLVAALALVAFCAFWGRAELARGPGACVLVATVASLVATLLQALALRFLSSAPFPDPPAVLALRFAAQTVLAAPTALVTAFAAHLFERLVGNLEAKPKGGVDAATP